MSAPMSCCPPDPADSAPAGWLPGVSTHPRLVTHRHTFHAAHRMPTARGRESYLHGHTFHAAVTYAYAAGCAPLAARETVGAWIAQNLDHAVILGEGDELAVPLAEWGRIFVFEPGAKDSYTHQLAWPDPAGLAHLIARVAANTLPLGNGGVGTGSAFAPHLVSVTVDDGTSAAVHQWTSFRPAAGGA